MAVYTVLTKIRMMYSGYFLAAKALRDIRITNLEERKVERQQVKVPGYYSHFGEL